MFILKKFLTALILPPTSFLLVTAVGILLALGRRTRTLGLLLAAGSTAALLALSTPFVSGHLTRLAGDSRLLTLDQLKWAEAIVIPSAGVRRAAAEYGKDVASGMSMDRIRYGAHLARASRLPVLVTGGQVYGGTPEAMLMREVLEDELAIPVKWVEAQSRNSHENAVFSARILHEAGVSKVVVVAHAVDARRFRREFEMAGLDVVIAPTQVPGSGKVDHWVQHMPSVSALHGSTIAIYELVAYLALILGFNAA